MRAAIRSPITCDIFQDDPLSPAHPEPFDLITSSLCLEAAAPDLHIYKAAVRKLYKYLKKGGYLVLVGVLNQNFYDVGDESFYSLCLSKADIGSSLIEAGFESPTWFIHVYDASANPVEYDTDAGGWFALYTRKL